MAGVSAEAYTLTVYCLAPERVPSIGDSVPHRFGFQSSNLEFISGFGFPAMLPDLASLLPPNLSNHPYRFYYCTIITFVTDHRANVSTIIFVISSGI